MCPSLCPHRKPPRTISVTRHFLNIPDAIGSITMQEESNKGIGNDNHSDEAAAETLLVVDGYIQDTAGPAVTSITHYMLCGLDLGGQECSPFILTMSTTWPSCQRSNTRTWMPSLLVGPTSSCQRQGDGPDEVEVVGTASEAEDTAELDDAVADPAPPPASDHSYDLERKAFDSVLVIIPSLTAPTFSVACRVSRSLSSSD